ncbi:hypothetical protein KSS87_008429 [Heliosperma pusillum]|nr:hypothetical protein KSS87_008429 [Heliosperma pusillum]
MGAARLHFNISLHFCYYGISNSSMGKVLDSNQACTCSQNGRIVKLEGYSAQRPQDPPQMGYTHLCKSHKRSSKNLLSPRPAIFKRAHLASAITVPPTTTMTNNETIITNPHNTDAPLTSLNLNHYVKLNPLNYISWHFQLTHILFGYSLLGVLDGTHPQPNKTITGADTNKAPNPAYYTWLKQDGLILGALMSTLSATVQSLIVRATTSKEA